MPANNRLKNSLEVFTSCRIKPPEYLSWVVFVLGISFYFVLQLGVLQLPVLNSRQAPREVDDAYVYMVKAEQMKYDFFQNSPALNDLRVQFSAPAEEFQIKWNRFGARKGFFLVYHPLHSVLLLAPRMFGLSLESSYKILYVVGTVFIGLAVAFWIKTLM